MQQELCLIHANCQGLPLAKLLCASPMFSQRWYCMKITNFEKNHIPKAVLSSCSLFLYQYLDEKWGALASAELVKQLSPTAQSLCLPNPFFKGYWPFWTGNSFMQFGDSYLDSLMEMGLEPLEAMHIYMHKPLKARFNLDQILDASLAIERERETRPFFQVLPYVLKHWQEEQLFTTISHPAPNILRMIANAVLARLGIPALTDDHLAAAGLDKPYTVVCEPEPTDVFELPIHPQVAAYYNLPFANENTLYRVFRKKMTFSQYIAAYIECYREKVPLLGYLATESESESD